MSSNPRADAPPAPVAAASPGNTAASPLAALHRRFGAVAWPTGEATAATTAVAGYGPPEAEHAALRDACGLVDRSPLGRLRLTGADRRRFLNGLVTCDVKDLADGSGVFGFFTAIKGQVLADVAVLTEGESLLLVLPPGRSAAIAEHLAKYKIVDRVEIDPAADRVPLTVAGARAGEALAAAGAAELPAADWGSAAAEVAGVAVTAVREGLLGVPAVTLWTPADGAVAVAEALLDRGAAAGLVPVGGEALEIVRVEAGLPRFGLDYGDGNFPQETGLGERAVSYSKGCYLGQEVVARIHYRGGVNRGLVGLRLAPAAGAAPPAPGAEVLHEGRAAGALGTVVHSAEAGGWVALAILHRRAGEPGTAVEIAGGVAAEVCALPF